MDIKKYLRECKERNKNKEIERDKQREKELIELKQQKAILQRKAQYNKIKEDIRKLKYPRLTKFLKDVGKNIKKKRRFKNKNFRK